MDRVRFPGAPGPGRVLIVEDDEDGREVMGDLLEMRGYLATSTASGRGARKLLADEPFDAVILDFGLPDQLAGEVIRAARVLPDPPAIIVFSGFHRIREWAVSAGCDAFILKPDLDRLLDQLRALVAARRTRPAEKQRTTKTGG
jgi:CheY-like chemotaxis protein